MLPKSGHRGLSITDGYRIVVFGWIKNVGVQDWVAGHLVTLKMSGLPPLLSAGHMAMNADLLAPSSSIFCLRGTTGEHVPATVMGLSFFPECVTISYEHSGHIVFPRLPRGAALLLLTVVRPHRLLLTSGLLHLQLTLRSMLRPSTFLHDTKDISMTASILPLPCFIVILVTGVCKGGGRVLPTIAFPP